MAGIDTDSEYECVAPGPSTKKIKICSEIVQVKCVTTYPRQNFEASVSQSTDNESRRGSLLRIIGDIVIEHEDYQMEVDGENHTGDNIQKPRQTISVMLNKAPKTSAERGREFRTRKALLKQQKQQQQQSDTIDEISTEDIQRPSQISIVEKRAKSADATRKWRAKKKMDVSESTKKQAKTAAQRMQEYRERKKLAKRTLLLQQSEQNLDAVDSAPTEKILSTGPSALDSNSAQLRRGSEKIRLPQSQQQTTTAVEHKRECHGGRDDNINIESFNLFVNDEENYEDQSDIHDSTPSLNYDDITKHKKAHEKYNQTFCKNPFGYSCTVCDRLWYKNDSKKACYNCEDLLKKITNANISTASVKLEPDPLDYDEPDHEAADKAHSFFGASNTVNKVLPSLSSDHLNEESNSRVSRSADNMSSVSNNIRDDEFDTFGKHVANQLRHLPVSNAILCQNYINNYLTEERLKVVRGQHTSATNVTSAPDSEVCVKIEFDPDTSN